MAIAFCHERWKFRRWEGSSPVATTKTGVKVHIPKRPIAGIGLINLPPEKTFSFYCRKCWS
jgi:hypothetical protein